MQWALKTVSVEQACYNIGRFPNFQEQVGWGTWLAIIVKSLMMKMGYNLQVHPKDSALGQKPIQNQCRFKPCPSSQHAWQSQNGRLVGTILGGKAVGRLFNCGHTGWRLEEEGGAFSSVSRGASLPSPLIISCAVNPLNQSTHPIVARVVQWRWGGYQQVSTRVSGGKTSAAQRRCSVIHRVASRSRQFLVPLTTLPDL